MPEREVVITGIGLLTPLGNNAKENFENLRAMKTGISHYQKEGLPEFLQYIGKVEGFEIPESEMPPKLINQYKFLSPGSILGFGAAREAVMNADIDLSDIPPGRRALYIASGDFTNIGYDFMYPAIKDATKGRWRDVDPEKLNTSVLNKVNPFFLLESIHNNLFSFLSAFFQLMGPNTSLASLSPYGGQALELACRSIKQHKADVALAVGCGSWVNDIAVYELEGLGILSKCTSGANSFRPFDRNRDGFIPGEGGAAIFVEASDAAERRGARVLGKIKGTGNCIELSPDRSMSVPEKVSRRSISQAMEEAGCSAHDLAFINPHGSATRKGDASELGSVIDLLGDRRPEVPICGMKPYTGHMGAASDIAEVIFGINALENRTVPATLNFEGTEQRFSGLKISGFPQSCKKDTFLSVSYGIGGQSSAVTVSVG